MGGPVIKGFGRGSKMLGIPTGMSPASFSILCFSFECWLYDDE